MPDDIIESDFPGKVNSVVDDVKLSNNGVVNSTVACSLPHPFVIVNGETRVDIGGERPLFVSVFHGVITRFDIIDNPLSRLVPCGEDEFIVEVKLGAYVRSFSGNMDYISGELLKLPFVVSKGKYNTKVFLEEFISYYLANDLCGRAVIPNPPGFFIGVDGELVTNQLALTVPSCEELSCGIDAYMLFRGNPHNKSVDFIDFQLKWFLMAPFSFIFKQLDSDLFFPILFKFGQPDTLKSSYSRDFYCLYGDCDDVVYDPISAATLTSNAKLDDIYTSSTFPRCLTEIATFLDTPLGVEFVEGIIKANTPVVRHNHSTSGDGRIVKSFLGLASMCLDGNYSSDLDPSILKRVTKIETDYGLQLSKSELVDYWAVRNSIDLKPIKYLFNNFWFYFKDNFRSFDFSDWLGIVDGYLVSIGLIIPGGQPTSLEIQSNSSPLVLDGQESLLSVDSELAANSYMNIFDAMVEIADKCYRDIRPDGTDKNWSHKYSKLKLGLENNQFNYFAYDDLNSNILFRNFKKDHIEKAIFKNTGSVGSIKDIHTLCLECGIKSMYKNVRFRGRPTLCTIVPVKDFLPVFFEIID
jgi:hypothetical protein